MAHSTLASEQVLPIDRFTPILKLCTTPAQTDTPARKLARLTSLKLDLRAIQEVEAMEGYATEEDFDELLFMPRVQDFLAQTRHDEPTSKAFWLLVRMRYLGLLQRPQRAQVMHGSMQNACQPALLLAEFYRLPNVPERLRLLSRLAYCDFAALIAETDRRALSLKADGGELLSSTAADQKQSEVRRSMRRTFLVR